MRARQLCVGDQWVWHHDEGHSYGYFHTYDQLRLCEHEQPRKVHILLPRDYETKDDKQYAVAYMNDGHCVFWPPACGHYAGKSWRVAEMLSKMYEDDLIGHDLIVVAVHPIDRDKEYTHLSWVAGTGGLEAYCTYLSKRLKPFVDEHYRTMAGHEHTLLVGAGHGGLASFYAAVSSTATSDNGSGKAAVKRKIFGFAGCISPSFWAGLDSLLLCSPSIPSPSLWETHNNELPLERSYLMHKVAQHLGERTARQNQERQEHLEEQEEKWNCQLQVGPKLWIDCGLEREDAWEADDMPSSPSSSSLEQLTARRATHMTEILQRRYGYHIGRDLFVFDHPHPHHHDDDDDDGHGGGGGGGCWGHNRLGLCILTFLLHQNRPSPAYPCHRVDQKYEL